MDHVTGFQMETPSSTAVRSDFPTLFRKGLIRTDTISHYVISHATAVMQPYTSDKFDYGEILRLGCEGSTRPFAWCDIY